MMHQHRTFGAYLDAVVLKSHFFSRSHRRAAYLCIKERKNGGLIKLMLNHDNCAQLLKLFSSRQAPHVPLPEKPMGLHERRYTLKNTFVSMGATKSKLPKIAALLKPFLEGLSTLDSLF